MYDSKFARFPGKFRLHWLGPYQVKHVIEGGAASLAKLDGTMVPTMVNGSRLKLYRITNPISLLKSKETKCVDVQCS